jgi:replication-associated recombination protein RarA
LGNLIGATTENPSFEVIPALIVTLSGVCFKSVYKRRFTFTFERAMKEDNVLLPKK